MKINTMGHARTWAAAFLLSTAGLALPGCDPLGLKPVARSVEDLAGSINNGTEGAERLRVTVENVPGELEKVLSQATADQKEIIRTAQSELRNMLSQTIQQGSVVPPFTFDYVREQVAFDLRTLAAKLAGKPLPKPIPRVAIPKATTLVRRDIGTATGLDWVVTGANLNAAGVRIVARGKDGAEIPLAVSMQTPYMLVVPFNEQNRTRLAEWTAIEVLTPNSREKVAVAVMDPLEPKREVVTKQDTQKLRPDAITLWPEYHPPKVEVKVPVFTGMGYPAKGRPATFQTHSKPAYDNEFDGNGPTTTVSAEFRVNPKNAREIQGNFAVAMTETNGKGVACGDKTHGDYTSGWITVSTLDVGQKLTATLPPKQVWTLRDANGTDLATEPGNHPYIASFTVLGDTKTNQDMATTQGDANKSHVTINFKTFPVDYEYAIR